jgi:hypothetical protein
MHDELLVEILAERNDRKVLTDERRDVVVDETVIPLTCLGLDVPQPKTDLPGDAAVSARSRAGGQWDMQSSCRSSTDMP